MAAIFGTPAVLWGSRSLFCRTVSPLSNQLFRRYAHSQPTDVTQKVKISPEVKKWLLNERALHEQARLKRLRDGAILDGLPKRGDRFYKASWEILTNETKEHS